MKGSRIIPAVLSGVEGNPSVLPELDRIILFDENTGHPIPPAIITGDAVGPILSVTLDDDNYLIEMEVV